LPNGEPSGAPSATNMGMKHALEGRRVLITGVSRGIGLQTAKRFLQEGASVLGVARSESRLAAALEALRPLGDVSVVRADLGEPESPARLRDAVAERWGALDILFNNAAIMENAGDPRTFEDEAGHALADSLQANVLAPFRLTMMLLPLLRAGREPRIVNVGSGAGTFEGIRLEGIASYRLSKWALHGLAILWSTHLAGEIAVNAFDPGWVKTDLGGPNAPGSPVDSAEGALAVATLPFSATGKLWKDGREIAF
jgi:NAD(P)-dependent dehydrogenase (short-subunit alcohol dehydrogenase family)